jgi:hypothetical protein
MAEWREKLARVRLRVMRWTARRPAGVRSLIGLGLILGGFLGFLPVLGFWMVPLGVAVIALDVALIRRRAARRVAAMKRAESR